MALDLAKMTKDLEDYLESDEGKKKIQEIKNRQIFLEKLEKRNLTKLESLTKEELYLFIDKCIMKYESQKYSDKEYKLGRQPNTDLYWVLYSYFEKKGIEIFNGEYISPFNKSYFKLHNKYVARVLHGQGSVCQIYLK